MGRCKQLVEKPQSGVCFGGVVMQGEKWQKAGDFSPFFPSIGVSASLHAGKRQNKEAQTTALLIANCSLERPSCSIPCVSAGPAAVVVVKNVKTILERRGKLIFMPSHVCNQVNICTNSNAG